MPIEAQQTKQQQRAALAALAARKQAEQRPTRDEKGEGEAGPREKKKKRKTDRTTTIGGEGKRRRRTDEAAEAAGYFSEDGEDDGENLDNRAQAIADANVRTPSVADSFPFTFAPMTLVSLKVAVVKNVMISLLTHIIFLSDRSPSPRRTPRTAPSSRRRTT